MMETTSSFSDDIWGRHMENVLCTRISAGSHTSKQYQESVSHKQINWIYQTLNKREQ